MLNQDKLNIFCLFRTENVLTLFHEYVLWKNLEKMLSLAAKLLFKFVFVWWLWVK